MTGAYFLCVSGFTQKLPISSTTFLHFLHSFLTKSNVKAVILLPWEVDNEKYQALLANETRYSRLTRAFPDRAKELFARNQEVANDRYEHLTRLVDLYK